MAKQNYLELTNRVLRRINITDISDVATATGQAKIITNLINEAQNELFTETNWYSLYTTRTFNTVASTATTAVASDFGRTIDMMDTTNNRMLIEEVFRLFDEDDPDANNTGIPLYFSIQGSDYRLYPIPDGIYTIRERYWKVPTVLSANANTSDLPIETENCIIQWALYKTLEYLNKLEVADRARLEFERMLTRAKASNARIIDKMHIMRSTPQISGGIAPPRFPAHYGRYF